MSPFIQFRLWLREGPRAERSGAAVAAVLLLALVAWALVPVDDGPGTDPTTLAATAPGADPGVATSGVPGDPASTTGPGGDAQLPGAPAVGGGGGAVDGATTAGGATPGAPVGAAAGPTDGNPCSGLGAPDQGVTPTEILVAVPLLNLAGDVGNETFGIRPDMEAVVGAVAAGINADGGVACRKLRVKTYRVNPLNANEQRSKCLEIVGTKPFAVIDFAAYLDPVARSCFPQNKIPYQGATSITEEEALASRPYMYSALASTDRQLRSWVFEAAARGTFDPAKGFRKLGLLLNACNPKVNDELRRNLAEVGVPNGSTSVFTASCTPVAPPNQVAQAITQHRQDGVSHVLLAAPISNGQNYVRNADALRFRPVYLGSDFGSVTVATSEGGWADAFDGAVAISSLRVGEIRAGRPHPLVRSCQEWLKRANVPAPDVEGDPAQAICAYFRLFKEAADKVGPGLTRATLLDGLARVGRFESGAYGTSVYDRPGKLWGGDEIRAVQWRASCRCWNLLDPDMKPGR